MKEILYGVVYAPTAVECNVAVKGLQEYKAELSAWVDDNEPKQWAALKFGKGRWGKINNNVIES